MQSVEQELKSAFLCSVETRLWPERESRHCFLPLWFPASVIGKRGWGRLEKAALKRLPDII